MFERTLNEICSHLSEKGPKGRFFALGILENHTSEGKEKRRKKERRERKEKREKAMVALLVFMLATLEAVLAEKKNCLTEEVFLAITFSLIRLDIFLTKRFSVSFF